MCINHDFDLHTRLSVHVEESWPQLHRKPWGLASLPPVISVGSRGSSAPTFDLENPGVWSTRFWSHHIASHFRLRIEVIKTCTTGQAKTADVATVESSAANKHKELVMLTYLQVWLFDYLTSGVSLWQLALEGSATCLRWPTCRFHISILPSLPACLWCTSGLTSDVGNVQLLAKSAPTARQSNQEHIQTWFICSL